MFVFEISIEKIGKLTYLDVLLMARYLLGSLVEGQSIESLPKPESNRVVIQQKFSVDSIKNAILTSFFVIGIEIDPQTKNEAKSIVYSLTVHFKLENNV